MAKVLAAVVTSIFKNDVSHSHLAHRFWAKAKGQKLTAKLTKSIAGVVTTTLKKGYLTTRLFARQLLVASWAASVVSEVLEAFWL